MDDGDEPLVQESAAEIVSGGGPSIRSAFFLLPRADAARPPSLPSQPRDPGPALDVEPRAEFKGWPGFPKLWRRWVAKLRPRHQRLWREVGILGAILASTRRVRRDEAALLQLAAFWSAGTNTFIFPWGEATVTLEDVAALAGLPLVGCPVRAALPYELQSEVAALEAVRTVLNRSKLRKPSYGAWVKHFLERASADSGGGGEARELVEHGAFLSMWLSYFVFAAPPFTVVRREMFPLAVRLARGQNMALAPAALASIYSDLSGLKRQEKEQFGVSSPMHILQVWMWEHFPELRPAMVSSPDPGDRGVPRAARWHDVSKPFHPKFIRAVFMSPKDFQWRPYGSSTFALPPETSGCWVYGQDIAGSQKMLSFARCLHPCELVGMNCIEKYRPHRVARQLGFDQDVPETVTRVIPKWKRAWDTYNIKVENSAFFVPNHKPGVTVEYVKWWKPYSLACTSAVDSAARTKRCRVSVTPIKTKMEGLPAANSGKKLRVNAMPQLASDEAEDLLDHIPLGERLNSIIKVMRKRTTEGLVKSVGQEKIAESPKCFSPKILNVGATKAFSNSNVEQNLSDDVPASSASIIGESSSGLVVTKAQGNCVQQSKEKDLIIANAEKNRRSEYDSGLLHNAVQGAMSTGSNEATGATNDVDMLPTLEDFLVISDDESDEVSEEGEVSTRHLGSPMFEEETMNEIVIGTMHLKSPKIETVGSILQDTNEEEQLVGENSGEDDPMLKDFRVQSKRDSELATALNDTTLRKEPHVASLQADAGRPERPIQRCFVAGEVDNRDKVHTEDSVEANREESGKIAGSSNRRVDGSTELDSSVICTKTIYYLSPFDLVKKSQGKDANSWGVDRDVYLPRRAIGTTEMIKKASAIRQAEIAELMKNIDDLKEEILALEVALEVAER